MCTAYTALMMIEYYVYIIAYILYNTRNVYDLTTVLIVTYRYVAMKQGLN